MSEFIKSFREQNPQYNDMADDQLVTALHNKYYSDIPVEQFNQKIGFQVAPIEPVQQDNLPVDANLGALPGNNLPIQQETLPVQGESLPAQQIPQQTVDGFTGAATKAPEEMSMLELVGGKLKNWGAGAGERAGDVGGALLSTIQTVGEGIEQKLPMGGFVWEDGDIIPSYKSPKEWAQTDAEPILNKGAEVLKGVDLGYQEQVGWEDVKKSFSEGGPLSGSAYADVLEYGIEQGVKSVPDMVAAIYALPTYIFARSGEIGEQRAQNKGKEKAELEDVLEAAPFAVASSLLERIGAKGITQAGKEEIGKEILKAGIKESTKRVAKAGSKALTKEAGTEAIQEGMIEYVGERYGTDVAMDWKEALDRAAAGAVAGGVFGGAGGLATSTANEINYSPEKVIAKQLEKDIEATEVVGTDQAAIEALSPEQAQIQQEVKPQQKQELKAKEPQAKPDPVKPVVKKEFEIDKAKATEQEPVALELPEEKPVKQQIVGKEVVEAPIEEITISEDVPQFKEGADVKGVVEPLGGKFERTGVAPVQIWVREDGRKEVISGRHRLDLAERSGEKTIPAQYHYESEGFGADQAAVLDAMLNIREGQGKVKDYVDFIKATKPRKAEAESQGILARQTGKRAFTIATEGSDALITSHRNDQLTDDAATRIAEAAPRNEALQAVGIKAIQDGKSIAVAENMVKAVKTMTDETAQQSGDLFGFDDSAMVEAENLAKAAVKKQSEIQKTLSAVQGAAKRPELAAKEGVDVKNPEAIKARIAELKEQKRDWQNWHTNPKLTQELKAQPEKAVTDEKPAITEEAKAQTPEPTAKPSIKEKDTFTNWNAKDSEGGPAEQSFTRGEYAKAIKSDSKGTFFDGGEIEGISQAKQQAKIKGVWHDFGSIVKADKPEPIKKPTKPMSEVVESVSKKKGKGLTDADKVPTHKPDYATEPAQAYRSFMESVANQTATVAEIKADAESLVKNKDAIIAKMSDRKFTKAMLQQITHSPRSDLKKPQMVKSAYESMLSAHVMGDATFTIFGGSKTYEQQMMEKINKQTQADVDAAYEKQREYRAQMKQRKDEFVKSLSNPETLPEFKEFIRVRGKDKMSPEQLAAYDELVAESMAEVKPEVVKAETEAVTTERAKTKHTKTGADLFVVKMVGRAPKEQFRELSGKAKQLGGYYSSYSKGDAIPGFQFKTVEAADQFEQLLSGKDVDKSDFAEAKAEVKQSKNADKLLNMAEKMEAKATEEINRPRQANTARRASMAANATERAEKQLALAKTVRNIAVKLQEGEVKHLGQMSQITQLEELITIQKRAIPNDLYEQGSFDGYSISRPLKEGVTVEDYINLVDFPGIELDSGIIDRVADTLKGKRGYARLSAELRKLPKGKRDSLRKLTKEQGDKIMAANKAGLLEAYSLSWLPEQVATLNRLGKLGISTGEQLRAAIRELDSLRVAKRQEDPVKKLERDLVGKKIEGFFPTPTPLVDQMIDYADIKPGHEVLEPSAGKGNIADQIMVSAPDASLDVVEYNTSLASLLEVKGYNVVGNDFLEYSGKQYDRIVMNPPFENFQDIDHVKHAYDLLKPGGKLVAIMGAGVKNSRKKAVEFREWLDDAGSYIEDLPEGSFKGSERSTGVNTVMVTIEKNDTNTLNYKKDDIKVSPTPKDGERVFHAPGHNFIGMFRSTGIPERRDFVTIEGRKLKIPDAPQRIEPIMSKLIKITGRRIYFGKIKGKSAEGFYRPNVGEIRTRRKNDVEVLAHEMAHYLDVYSNITLPNFQKLYKDPKYSSEVAALSYTDADPKIEKIEGFAEFVRLWLTNANEAQLRAPKFYDAFTNELARDRKLLNPMRDMQDLMHKFYFQGPDKLGQALIGQDVSFKQRFNEWAYRRDSRIRQQVIDRFHAARKVEQELTRKIGTVEESAWKQFRIANGGAEGISDYILNYGTVQFDEKGDLKRSGKSLHEVMEPVKTIKLKPEHEGDQKIDLLMRYFAGRRALELHRQKRENLIPKETAKEWARLGKDYPVFESIQKEYQEFNDRMMDFYEEAGMVTPEGRKTMQSMNKDYVPFNRIRDQLAGGKGAASAGFQKLKGGTANLNDILVNIQDGITANVRSALNNRAKQRLYQYISGHKDGAIFATKIAPDSKPVQVYADEMQAKISKVLEANGIEIEGVLDLASKELLTFWQHGVAPRVNESGNIVDSVIINGKPKYYEVQDPLLQEMLMSMNPESYSSFMNVMFGVKNFFTRTITLGIEFTGANLVRDTVGATFLSKNNFKPFISSFQGMYSFLAKDKYYQDFIRSGGGHSSRLEGATRDSQARRRVKLDEFGVMTGPERLLSSIDNLASAFEYGTRIGEYRLAKKNMKSDMDAGFDAREISTDFSVLGANRFLTGYIRTVPFLNAMVQSQDRVFREAAVSKRYDGNPTGMAMKAFLGITVPTLILYLVNKDDEDYKAIPDYEKRTNWHIKIGDGQFVKIPRPYDVGFVYATMPELFAKYVEDDKGKEFADGMLWTMTQMYGIDGTPAMMTGWWDLVRNEKWTGAPVVPQSLSDVEAPEQYTSNTSETFVRMGEALGVSPIKAEHMFKAYTGYLGGYLMAGTDHLLWDESKFGEKPDRKLSENVFLRRFLTPDVRPATANMEKFFNLKEQSDKIVSTFKQTVDVRRQIKGQGGTGKFKDDKFFGLSSREKEVLFGLNDSMNQLIKLMYGKEGIKTAELKIKYDKKLSGKEKREQMDKLWLARNKAFETYYQQANQALQKQNEKQNRRNNMAVAMIGPKFYAWDKNGKPLAFGKLYTYQARTNIPKPTYQSEDQIVENSNPVTLNGEGYANVYLSGQYKMVLKDSDENEIWSADPVSSNMANEWVNCMVATYLSPTTFKVTGNFISVFDKNRKVRLSDGGTSYLFSTISDSSYAGGETTVTISDAIVSVNLEEVCTSIVGPDSSLNISEVESVVGNISNYIFDSVSDMKSVPNSKGITLKEGDSVCWNNYYSDSNGGGGCGVVKDSVHTEDGGSIFTINGNLHVETIFSDLISDLSFGAKIDHSFDSVVMRQNCIDYAASVSKVAVLSHGTVATDVLRVKSPQEIWDFATRANPTRIPLANGVTALRIQTNETPVYKGGFFIHFDYDVGGITRLFQTRGSRTGIGLHVFGDIVAGSSVQATMKETGFEGFGIGGQYAGCFNSSFYDLTMKRNDTQTLLLNDTNQSVKFYNLRSNLDCVQHVIGDPILTGVGFASSGATFFAPEWEDAVKFPWFHVKSGQSAWYNIVETYSLENNNGTDPTSKFNAVRMDCAGMFHMKGGAINSVGKADSRLFYGRRGASTVPWNVVISDSQLDSRRGSSGADFDIDYDAAQGDLVVVNPDCRYINPSDPDHQIAPYGVEQGLIKSNSTTGERMLWHMNAARMRLDGWALDQRIQNAQGHFGIVHPGTQNFQAGGYVFYKSNGSVNGHLFADDATGDIYYKLNGLAGNSTDGTKLN